MTRTFYYRPADDITNEEGQFTIHFSPSCNYRIGGARKKAHFHLRSPLESIESIINNPPDEHRCLLAFKAITFVIVKLSDLYKATSYYQSILITRELGQSFL